MGHSTESTLRDLASPERELLLRELKAARSLSVHELTDRMAGQLEEASRKRLQIRLHHVHLPRLDDRGIIQWEQVDGHVRQGAGFDAVVSLLDTSLYANGVKVAGD